MLTTSPRPAISCGSSALVRATTANTLVSKRLRSRGSATSDRGTGGWDREIACSRVVHQNIELAIGDALHLFGSSLDALLTVDIQKDGLEAEDGQVR
ncbi:hypothetical protein CMQ_574 [Grosmannia clavigera kw1407]|uniref:Uncharacterized protein n=1 Tax=Grosmannia clavigera (strain kw1407 / UAMH 11150) TaxID=655863 RepID=F0XF88_GROCL|nr:uncharacterized protein CMQ_574 [Grosmannia clavigera kw1407]EFX03646.1 hypothetical protein CMQ_574 [Grosmannia clavigera kw1407]